MYRNPLCQHLEKLQAFVDVVRLGSITKAAKVLSISQAALSQSLKVFEEALGMQLLERSRSGVRPTEQGRILYDFGLKLAADLELTHQKINNPTKGDLVQIRIGTHEALASHWWPEVVASFQKNHTHVSLSLVSGRVHTLMEQLLDGHLDMLLTVKPRERTGVTTKVVYQDQFSFYGAKGASNQQREELPILTDSQAHMQEDRSVIQALAEVGISSSYFQLNSFQAAARLAAKGVGIALLPEKIAAQMLRRGEALTKVSRPKVSDKIFKHKICASFLKDNKQEGTAALLKHMKIQ